MSELVLIIRFYLVQTLPPRNTLLLPICFCLPPIPSPITRGVAFLLLCKAHLGRVFVTPLLYFFILLLMGVSDESEGLENGTLLTIEKKEDMDFFVCCAVSLFVILVFLVFRRNKL